MIKSAAIGSTLLLVIAFSVSCVARSRLENAREFERKEKYEEAIREASSREALIENPSEAKQIISRSQRAKMYRDIELAWTLSDEELKDRGIIVARDCFRSGHFKPNKREQDDVGQPATRAESK